MGMERSRKLMAGGLLSHAAIGTALDSGANAAARWSKRARTAAVAGSFTEANRGLLLRRHLVEVGESRGCPREAM